MTSSRKLTLPDGYSRAPAPLTEERVAHIMTMMRGLLFRTGDTVKELAKEWDLCEQRVRELTAEASRRVKAEVMNPEQVGATVGMALEKTLHRAMEEGDHRNVIAAAKTWQELAIPVQGGGLPQFKTAQEALDYIRRITPALEAQAAREATDATNMEE